LLILLQWLLVNCNCVAVTCTVQALRAQCIFPWINTIVIPKLPLIFQEIFSQYLIYGKFTTLLVVESVPECYCRHFVTKV